MIMRRPQDPRHHGLKEPQKVIQITQRLALADLSKSSSELSLRSVINAWSKTLKDHESQGHRIAEGPYFSSSTFYGSALSLTYTYEWDNVQYAEEKLAYDAAVSDYESQLERFKLAEEKKKGAPPDVDDQIARAEKRLANLKAVKLGVPIPYPEG
jgi:hypothetical protein